MSDVAKGWLKDIMKDAKDEIASWPEWKRQAGGIEPTPMPLPRFIPMAIAEGIIKWMPCDESIDDDLEYMGYKVSDIAAQRATIEQQAQELERFERVASMYSRQATDLFIRSQELTQQLAAMTTARDEAQQRYERQCTDTKSRIEEIVHLRRDCEAWAHNYQLLQQQLATAQARVNELETKLSYAEQDW